MVPIEERANRLLKDEIVSVDAKNYITYYLTNIFRLEESDVRNFAAWRDFSEMLDLIESGRYDEYLESPGTKKYHCLSIVDNHLIEYVLCFEKVIREIKYPYSVAKMLEKRLAEKRTANHC